MERHHFICCLAGYFIGTNPKLEGSDLKIKIDERLFQSKFTPLGTEEGDLELLDELVSEMLMSVIGRGFNRDNRRKKI